MEWIEIEVIKKSIKKDGWCECGKIWEIIPKESLNEKTIREIKDYTDDETFHEATIFFHEGKMVKYYICFAWIPSFIDYLQELLKEVKLKKEVIK